MTDTQQTPTSSRTVSYLAWRVDVGAVMFMAAAATFCLLADLLIWGLTFASPTVTMPDWIFAPFFAFAIIGNFVTIAAVTGFRRARSDDLLRMIARLPKALIAILILIGVAMFITGPAALAANVPGQPGYNPTTGRYYFDDHGEIIPRDRAHYLSAVATQTRSFISFAILFTCFMLLLASAGVRARRGVDVSRFAEVPWPPTKRPRLCPPARISLISGVVGLALFIVTFAHIVEVVDAYASTSPPVTLTGVTQQLQPGQWVVFTWCETHATDAPYGCPTMTPPDIVIRSKATGVRVPTYPDPSDDHISPQSLPAAGQLSFAVTHVGEYRLRLTRPVPKGVFVANSPGTIARSLAETITLAALGLITLALALVSLGRWVAWRYRFVPRVVLPWSSRS